MPQISKKWNILIPREIQCCYFIAFENFYFHPLVRSSVRVYIGYTWTDQASPRKKLLAHRGWWPLANILLRMGLSPGRRALLFVWFLNVRPGTTPVTESTLYRGWTPITGFWTFVQGQHPSQNQHCSEGEHPSQVQHQYFFINILCTKYIKK